MLDLNMLKEMPTYTVFARGEGNYPSIYKEPIRWIAVRGGGWSDWAIYYQRQESNEPMLSDGEKVILRDNIQLLVPCTKDALDMYRL
jgi:hypothetical protein